MFHKAERKKGKLRLGIADPAGSGKTYSALRAGSVRPCPDSRKTA
jgi:K+-sensing histidine kinase KdpD